MYERGSSSAKQTMAAFVELARSWIQKARDEPNGLRLFQAKVSRLCARNAKQAPTWKKMYTWLCCFKNNKIIDSLPHVRSASDRAQWQFCFQEYHRSKSDNGWIQKLNEQVDKTSDKKLLSRFRRLYAEVKTNGNGDCMYLSLLELPFLRPIPVEYLRAVRRTKWNIVWYIRFVILRQESDDLIARYGMWALQGFMEVPNDIRKCVLTEEEEEEYQELSQLMEQQHLSYKEQMNVWKGLTNLYCNLTLIPRFYGGSFMLDAYSRLSGSAVVVVRRDANQYKIWEVFPSREHVHNAERVQYLVHYQRVKFEHFTFARVKPAPVPQPHRMKLRSRIEHSCRCGTM